MTHMIPDWVADELGRQLGFADGKTALAAIEAAETRTPQIIKDALTLGERQPTFAAGIVACLRHIDHGYIGDIEIERALGLIATLIEEHAP